MLKIKQVSFKSQGLQVQTVFDAIHGSVNLILLPTQSAISNGPKRVLFCPLKRYCNIFVQYSPNGESRDFHQVESLNAKLRSNVSFPVKEPTVPFLCSFCYIEDAKKPTSNRAAGPPSFQIVIRRWPFLPFLALPFFETTPRIEKKRKKMFSF